MNTSNQGKSQEVSGGEATPGPWVVWSSIYKGMVAEVRCAMPGEERPIAEVRKHTNSYRDALQIAATPDLLAAAREIDSFALVIESAVRDIEPVHYAAVLAALKANIAAIAKATGHTTPASPKDSPQTDGGA
jgi:hypothetical protein